MIFSPDDIMPEWSVNKGYSVGEVYKYYPEYIEWLMINKSFTIDVDKFKKLPGPTDLAHCEVEIMKVGEKEYRIYKINKRVEKDIAKQVFDIREIERSFSEIWNLFIEKNEASTFNNYVGNALFTMSVLKKLDIAPLTKPFKFSQDALIINKCNIVLSSIQSTFDKNYKEANEKYNGYNGWGDEAIDSAFDGDPKATWNVD